MKSYWGVVQPARREAREGGAEAQRGPLPLQPYPGRSGQDARQGDARATRAPGTILAAVIALATFALCGMASADECGVLKPEWCAKLETGVASVITNGGEKREYALGAVTLAGPVGAGLNLEAQGELLGDQDGGALNYSNPSTFRDVVAALKLDRTVGKVTFAARGSVTFSVEGQVGAPIDPRLWTAEARATLKSEKFSVTLGGGHDGTVGGGAAYAELSVPLKDAPAIVTRYSLPLHRPNPTANLPWVLNAEIRVQVAKFPLAGLFK